MWLLPLAWGTDLARGDAGQVLRGRRGCARADDGVPLHHGLPGGADGRRLGARRRERVPASRRTRRCRRCRLGARRVLGARAADRRHEVDDAERVLHGLGLQRLVRRAEDPRLAVHGRALRRRAASRSSRSCSPSGVVVCAVQARRDIRARALLGAFALSLLLFFGRPTLGALLDLLPGFQRRPDPPLRDGRPPRRDPARRRRARLAAPDSRIAIVGALSRRRTGPLARRGRRRWCLPSLVLAPAWTERAALRPARGDADPQRSRRPTRPTGATSTGSSRIVEGPRRRPRLRRAARQLGHRTTSSAPCPCYAWLADRDVDAIGFTFRTIAVALERRRGVLRRDEPRATTRCSTSATSSSRPTASPACRRRFVASSGRHRLWEVRDERLLPGRRPRAGGHRRPHEPRAGDARTSCSSRPRVAGHLPGRRVRRRRGAAADVRGRDAAAGPAGHA